MIFQVSVGYIVPGGSADVDSRIQPGDDILYVDNQNVIGSSHHKVVQIMGAASNKGQVALVLKRRPFGGNQGIKCIAFRSKNLNIDFVHLSS